MNVLVRMALGFEGMPEQTIENIEKQEASFKRLADAAKELEPILAPAIAKAMPILKRAYPDLVNVYPVALEVMKFINSKNDAAH